MLTLGLDLGPTSIGWGLVDEKGCKIVAAGVRIFPEGVDRDQQGGEKSKNVARRTSRGMRRQIARRARRKRDLRKLLTGAGLLPGQSKAMEALLGENPYTLRASALDERLTPHKIGRVLLHLNQRRGFLSNRKTDKARSEEVKGMLAEIGALGEAIDRANCRTLGEYLAQQDREYEHTSLSVPVRRRHTQRDMYEREFDAVWDSQKKFHADLLTDDLQERVRGLVFFQRKIYWPKSVVGRCELEPKKKRCPRADRSAQRFRMLGEINNLRMTDTTARSERELTAEERAKVTEYLAGAKERSFDQIRKKLGFDEHVRFNYERAERKKLKGHETDAALSSRKVLGKRWKEFSEEGKDEIVSVLMEEEDEHEALDELTGTHGLTRDEAERALDVNLPSGYMSYSRDAIVRLLPYMERGLPLMGDDASNSALHAAGYLRPDEREVRQRDFLPASPDLANPIVRHALVEVRKLVNAVIREYGKPGRIHIELAREAKKSLRERNEIRYENSKRRRRREEAAARIEEAGDKPTGGKIKKYLLWEEQERLCVYSGRAISFTQLLSDAISVDHILPRWRSLDDSMANKVVCFRAENEAKGDQTPREWLEDGDPTKYERVLRLAEKLPGNKLRKFIQTDIVLDDFVQRQLRDTAYISRCVTQYVGCLGVPITCTRGQMTADLRHYWGLNTILDPKGRGVKNRADHRHHAIDALVIALMNPKRLHALAKARGQDVPQCWDRFREGVNDVVGGINVSYRVQRGLYGGLHEETFYGRTCKRVGGVRATERPWATDWVEEPNTYVRRKAVTDLTTTKHLGKVRDRAIRVILERHLRARGVDPAVTGKIPKDAFKGANAPCMPSGVPIRRVRMIEESETFRPVSERRSYQYVKPGNNHHIVYRRSGKREAEKWNGQVVPMWDAAMAGRNREPVVDKGMREGASFVMSLSINEMFQIDGPDGVRLLCVVRKMDQRSRRMHYKLHTDARQAGDINKDNLYLSPDNMRRRNARKVTLDLLGRVRDAHD